MCATIPFSFTFESLHRDTHSFTNGVISSINNKNKKFNVFGLKFWWESKTREHTSFVFLERCKPSLCTQHVWWHERVPFILFLSCGSLLFWDKYILIFFCCIRLIISRIYPTNEVLESSSQHWMHTLLYGELEFSELCKKWHRCVMNLTLKDQPLKPSIKDKVDLLCFNTTHYFNILHLCVFHYLGFWRGTLSLFKIILHLCI